MNPWIRYGRPLMSFNPCAGIRAVLMVYTGTEGIRVYKFQSLCRD